MQRGEQQFVCVQDYVMRSDYTCVIRNRGSWAHMGSLFFENMPCAHLQAREMESIYCLLLISMFFSDISLFQF